MLIYDTSKRISGEPLCTLLMDDPLNTCSISSQTGSSSQLFRGLPSVIAARSPDGTVPPYHPFIHPFRLNLRSPIRAKIASLHVFDVILYKVSPYFSVSSSPAVITSTHLFPLLLPVTPAPICNMPRVLTHTYGLHSCSRMLPGSLSPSVSFDLLSVGSASLSQYVCISRQYFCETLSPTPLAHSMMISTSPSLRVLVKHPSASTVVCRATIALLCSAAYAMYSCKWACLYPESDPV